MPHPGAWRPLARGNPPLTLPLAPIARSPAVRLTIAPCGSTHLCASENFHSRSLAMAQEQPRNSHLAPRVGSPAWGRRPWRPLQRGFWRSRAGAGPGTEQPGTGR